MKDQLTGLLNHDAFRLLAEHELIVARRLGRIDTLLVIDVENLQSVNHIFGREGGDETLRSIGRLLQRTARESDIIGRIGDDEFAIFALDCVGDALAKRVSAAVSRAGDDAPSTSSRELTVRVRVGLTEVAPGEEFDELMTRAGPSALRRARHQR